MGKIKEYRHSKGYKYKTFPYKGKEYTLTALTALAGCNSNKTMSARIVRVGIDTAVAMGPSNTTARSKGEDAERYSNWDRPIEDEDKDLELKRKVQNLISAGCGEKEILIKLKHAS